MSLIIWMAELQTPLAQETGLTKEGTEEASCFLQRLKKSTVSTWQKLLDALDLECWMDFGWTYFFYFYTLSLLIKMFAFFLVLTLAKDLIEYLVGLFVDISMAISHIDLGFFASCGVILIAKLVFGAHKLFRRHRLDSRWSESDFSLLVTNLPTDIQEEELRKITIQSVENFLGEKDIPGKVQDLIFLHDSEKYIALQEKLNRLQNKILDLKGDEKKKEELTKKVKVTENKIEAIEESKLSIFKGRAIIIFTSAISQQLFKRNLSFYGLFWSGLKIGKTIPRFWMLYEPSEMRFRVLHRGFFLRFILITFTQFIILYLLVIAIAYRDAGDISLEKGVGFIGHLKSFFEAGLVLSIPLASFYLIKYLNNRVPYRSKSTKYRSYIVHSFLHCMIAITFVDVWYLDEDGTSSATSKILNGLIFFLIVSLLKKGAMVIYYKRKSPNNYKAFDFWCGFNSIYQLIALGIYYLSVSPIAILGLAIVITFSILVIDKWYILKYTKRSKVHSFEIGLCFYSLISINLMVFFFLLQAGISFHNEFNGGGTETRIMQYLSITIEVFCYFLVVISLCFCRYKPQNDTITYEEASKSFRSFYAQEYPLSYKSLQIKNIAFIL